VTLNDMSTPVDSAVDDMRINPWRPVDIRPDAVEIPGLPGS